MSSIKVLLTAGEKILADRVCKALLDARYRVDQAYDGRMGKQLFDFHGYDLVLIDIHLPDINGCQLCYYIRGRNMNIPLLVFSSVKAHRTVEAFEAGADDYLMLSDDMRELLMRVQALARRSVRPASGDNRIAVRDIVMYLDSKEVWKANRQVLLSAREFLLLQYLIRNKNRIVSSVEIGFNIWASGSTAKMGRVSAFINSLRKKIEDTARTRYLYTVTGKGYLLSEKTG